MPYQLPETLLQIAELQSGVISRQQAIDGGLPAATIDNLASSGRWMTLRRGVYSIYSGEPSREAALWAALLRIGPDAVLSHQTAAELQGLYDCPSTLIHVTLSQSRRVRPLPDVALHRSTRLEMARHPSQLPYRTRIEETVLDLAHQAASFDPAFNVVCAACQRRLTTADKLRAAMMLRARMRWRTDLQHALSEIGAGAHSLLEYRYVRHVEAPHKLPRARRQATVVVGNRRFYLDNLYDGYSLGVELDGREAHPDDRRWLDVKRDNATATLGILILRYGWADVTVRRCATAIEVGTVLGTRGWTGAVRPCGPHCPVGAR
jgi:putative AbiEi antitoxin of type IV toxin-antitoxin system